MRKLTKERRSVASRMYDRVVRNWRTSAMAAVLAVFVGMLAAGRIDSTQFAELAGTLVSVRLFLSKDDKPDPPAGGDI